MNYEELKVFTDGGSRGNPGPSASGVVFMTTDDEVVDAFGKYWGTTTNNQAEYRAVRLALEKIADLKPKRIQFYLDSELVVKQLNGLYKQKNADLKPVFDDIKRLAGQYESVTFTHVYRADNKLADAEVNKAIDAALS